MHNSVDYSEVVDAVYRAVLRREPDSARSYYINALQLNELTLEDFLKICVSLDEFFERAEPSSLYKAIQNLYGGLGNPFEIYEGQKQLIFWHFPKTAGTSLSNALAQMFHPMQIYRPKAKHISCSVEIAEINPRPRFHYKHYDWNSFVNVSQLCESITFTCLRMPGDRLRSLFFFLRSIKESVIPPFVEAAHATSGKYEDFFLSEQLEIKNVVNNYYVRSLADAFVTKDGDPLYINPEKTIDLALKRLFDFDMVMFSEELRASKNVLPERVISTLSKHFRISDNKIVIPELNRAVVNYDFNSIPHDLIYENVHFDLIFCEAVKNHYGITF